jgi:hypothetical protein
MMRAPWRSSTRSIGPERYGGVESGTRHDEIRGRGDHLVMAVGLHDSKKQLHGA